MAAVTVTTGTIVTESRGVCERSGRVLAAGGGGRSAETWKRHIVRQLKHRDLSQHAMFQDLIRFCKTDKYTFYMAKQFQTDWVWLMARIHTATEGSVLFTKLHLEIGLFNSLFRLLDWVSLVVSSQFAMSLKNNELFLNGVWFREVLPGFTLVSHCTFLYVSKVTPYLLSYAEK